MDPAEAFARAEEVCYLDVREPYEWDAGHIDGSLHVPMGDIQVRVEELEKDRPIIVVCQVGQRSALVSEYLAALGFTAHNLEGGLDAWQSEGYPLVAKE
jgi:rhodanese-related sulfurtransferase